MIRSRPLAAFACLNGAMAVALGAFAAHSAGPAVKTLLTTGAQYQMVHSLLALACVLWPARDRLIVVAGWMAAAGGLIFSLAVSAIALLSFKAMGAVAPIGGLLMILAWILLAIRAMSAPSNVA